MKKMQKHTETVKMVQGNPCAPQSPVRGDFTFVFSAPGPFCIQVDGCLGLALTLSFEIGIIGIGEDVFIEVKKYWLVRSGPLEIGC